MKIFRSFMFDESCEMTVSLFVKFLTQAPYLLCLDLNRCASIDHIFHYLQLNNDRESITV